MTNRLFIFTLSPKFSAYKSPKSIMFRFLDINKLAKSPRIMLIEKSVNLVLLTAENEPIPQITKAWMSSFMLKNFIMSVKEPARYETIKPMIINVVIFLTRLLKPSISIKTKVAPKNAAMLTPIFDHNPKVESAFPPKMPVNKIVIATPNPAPLLIPSIEGSARGFLNNVCIKSPATDKAAPAKSAVTACGSLYSKTIVDIVEFVSSPKNTLNKSAKGIVTDPTNRLRKNNNIPKNIIAIKMLIFILL